MPKEEREAAKKKDMIKYKLSKKRCNLYVKNFPPSFTQEDMANLFAPIGDIESIKLLPEEGAAHHAFVCYKAPDMALRAKQELDRKPIEYVNHYEIKEHRLEQIQRNRNKADF